MGELAKEEVVERAFVKPTEIESNVFLIKN